MRGFIAMGLLACTGAEAWRDGQFEMVPILVRFFLLHFPPFFLILFFGSEGNINFGGKFIEGESLDSHPALALE